MYKIEKVEYGFFLTFGGRMDIEEMTAWLEDSQLELAEAEEPFYVFVDMRTLELLEPEVQKVMNQGQQLYKIKGMKRSVVILNNHTLTIQFKRIALQSGIYDTERYIDASSNSNWKELGLKWLLKGVDPEKTQKINTAKV